MNQAGRDLGRFPLPALLLRVSPIERQGPAGAALGGALGVARGGARPTRANPAIFGEA